MSAWYLKLLTLKFGEPIREHSNGEVEFRCPECGNTSLFGNVYKGVYYCFFCGLSGRLHRGNSDSYFPRKPDRVPDSNVLRDLVWICLRNGLNPEVREFLKVKGVLCPEKYMIGQVPSGVVRDLMDLGYTLDELVLSGVLTATQKGTFPSSFLSYGRIVIPHIADGKFLGIKTRKHPLLDDGLPKYLASPGYSAKYPWMGILPKVALEFPLVVTEGEFKAISVQEKGLPAISCSGVSSLRRSLKILSRIVRRKEWFIGGTWTGCVPDMVIVFDNDVRDSTRIPVKDLERLGISYCHIVLPESEFKQELDSMVATMSTYEVCSWILTEVRK